MSQDETQATHRFFRSKPAGDDRERLVCADCGFVNYENPRIVVGAVALWQEKILMCRRAINPRKGFWTLPAGYLEQHEKVETGALREAFEEARARIEIDQLLAVYTIQRLSQVQLIFRARLLSDEISAGPESLEVALIAWDQIPWDLIAFPSVKWALKDFAETRLLKAFPPRGNPANLLGNMDELA